MLEGFQTFGVAALTIISSMHGAHHSYKFQCFPFSFLVASRIFTKSYPSMSISMGLMRIARV